MSHEELLKKIEALEKRVEELERKTWPMQQVGLMYQPQVLPEWVKQLPPGTITCESMR